MLAASSALARTAPAGGFTAFDVPFFSLFPPVAGVVPLLRGWANMVSVHSASVLARSAADLDGVGAVLGDDGLVLQNPDGWST